MPTNKYTRWQMYYACCQERRKRWTVGYVVGPELAEQFANVCEVLFPKWNYEQHFKAIEDMYNNYSEFKDNE